MEFELSIENLVFRTAFSANEIGMVCCYCGHVSPLDGGYFSAVRLYPNEPIHFFYACGCGCVAALYDENQRNTVNRFLNRQVQLTRIIHQFNKSKNHG